MLRIEQMSQKPNQNCPRKILGPLTSMFWIEKWTKSALNCLKIQLKNLPSGTHLIWESCTL